MIIVNEAVPSPSKSPVDLGPDNLAQGFPFQLAPPPYNTDEDPSEPLIAKKVKPASRRFLEALILAVMIQLALGAIIFVNLHTYNSVYDDKPDVLGEPIEEDGVLTRCHIPWKPTVIPPKDQFPTALPYPVGSDPVYDRLGNLRPIVNSAVPPEDRNSVPMFFAYTSLELPVNSSGLYLLSRGMGFGGIIRLETYEPKQAEDKVKVRMHLQSWNREFIDRVNVCTLMRNETYGAGIYFTPYSPAMPVPSPQLWISVTVAFPASIGSPLQLKSFATNLALFEHRIGNLTDLISFGDLNFKTTRGRIHALSVQAENIKLETTASMITGRYNVTRSLTMSTTNAPIVADLGVHHQARDSASKVRLCTTNGYIRSNISLYSTNMTGSIEYGGFYDMSTKATNGRIHLNFPTSPVESQLDLDVQTSNAPVTVELNSAFQGTFEVFTTNADHQIRWDQSVSDPSQRGLERNVSLNSFDKGTLKGDVWWGDAKNDTSKGSVRIRSTNGKVVVGLDPMEQ